MVIHTSLDSVSKIQNPVVTTGTFDGVHLGHQKIIRKLKKHAEKIKGETVLFTFYPHPRMVLFPDDHGLKLINSLEEKKERLKKAGLDHLILFPFSQEFSRLSALQYVRDVLVNKINVHTIIVGYDHHFGKNREGDLSLLRELANTYNFKVKEISALDIQEVNVSSTKIRNSIADGNITQANSYLGYNYYFSGTVIKGEQRGRKLGYKTANLSLLDSFKLIPDSGVYACQAILNEKKLDGMLNIGSNPTFNQSNSKHIEAHLFDFDENIYGHELTIEIIKKLRDEQKFENSQKLVQQLNEDKARTIEVLKN